MSATGHELREAAARHGDSAYHYAYALETGLGARPHDVFQRDGHNGPSMRWIDARWRDYRAEAQTNAHPMTLQDEFCAFLAQRPAVVAALQALAV